VEGLNGVEQAVLDKLLFGDHPVLVTLRNQTRNARLIKREYTGVGFYCTFEVLPDSPLLEGKGNFEITDVNGETQGLEHGVGFVLFVRDGRLDTLEGFTFDEPWPASMRDLILRYSREPERDLRGLEAAP
jgi:hypothetical protein